MRICLVTRGDLFPPNHGAAVKIVRTAEYLSLQGAEVFCVTEDRDAYHRWKRGRHERLPYSPRARAAQEWPGLRAGGRFAEALCARIGYPSEEFFLYVAQFDPAWWLRLLDVGFRERVDVFQAEFPGYAAACWLAARVLGRRSSIVQHNVEWDRLQDVCGYSEEQIQRIRACELFALEQVDEVIAVSRDDKDRMSAAGIDPEKITIIPHGVDLDRYRRPRGREVRFSYGIDPEVPLLFFHGTLHYAPNTDAVRFLAEELLPALLPRVPELKILVAGVNPPRYYAHPALHFTGPVQDLPGHIAAADLTLCPVFSGGGTRMKILEYFAAGQACVASRKGAEGIRYQPGVELEEAETGPEFAEAIVSLLEQPQRRQAMGQAALEFVRWFDWGPITQRYLELYRGRGRGADYFELVEQRRAAGERPPPALVLPATAAEEGIERHLPLREPSKPLTLLLLINRGCNLRCQFCDLWDRPQNMEWERLIPLLDQAQAIGTKTLVITGGEPLIHPRIFEVVAEARARGMGVNITTNGTLVEKHWERLVSSGVSSLSLSLDGLEETHDELRKQKGAYRRTLKALRRLRTETSIQLSIYFTVTRQNVEQLTVLFDLSQELGVEFDFWPVNDAEDLYLTSEEDQRRYREAVEYIGQRRESVRTRRHFYEEGLRYHGGVEGRVRCLGLVDQYGVTYEGDLLPCCVWGGDGLKVGNVFETPLTTLWTSEEVQSYREGLYQGGCDAGCFNHSLYEFTHSTGESFRVPEASEPA